MSELRVLNAEGVTVGKAALSEALAGQPIKPHLIHETVVAELAARRRGTHSTKTRSDVRGGGAKPWRQKGTGRARAGSIRSPLWTGGGTTFGPQPRDYGGKVNRKIRRQAFHSALRAHAERGSAAVMEPVDWETPSTKAAAAYLFQAPDGLQARPLLVVTADPDGVVARSFRNIAGVAIAPPDDVATVDLMQARALLVERAIWERWAGESAIEAVTARKRRAAKKKAAPAEAEATEEEPTPKKKPAATKSATTKRSPAKSATADTDDEKKPAPKKKPAAKKSTAKKSTAKKSTSTKKSTATKSTTKAASTAKDDEKATPKKKPAAKKTAAKKPAAKKPAAKKPAAKKDPAEDGES